MATGLKQHKDVVYSTDLTSYQIWTVFNNLLFEAAAPLSAYGDMSLETAISCIAISTDNRRRLAVETQTELLESLFCDVCQHTEYTEDYKISLLKTLLRKGIERNVIVDHIAFAVQTLKVPKHISRKKLTKHVASYLDSYETFKKDLVFRYWYLIENIASRNHFVKSLHGLKTTRADMFHVYIISTERAIDKFSPFKGTITENIIQWFQNAQGSSDFIVYDNEAYSINRGVRKSVQDGGRTLNNKAIPIQDRENSLAQDEGDDVDTNFAEYSRDLAKMPNATIVFLAQNLPYTLSADQIASIQKHNREVVR